MNFIIIIIINNNKTPQTLTNPPNQVSFFVLIFLQFFFCFPSYFYSILQTEISIISMDIYVKFR